MTFRSQACLRELCRPVEKGCPRPRSGQATSIRGGEATVLFKREPPISLAGGEGEGPGYDPGQKDRSSVQGMTVPPV